MLLLRHLVLALALACLISGGCCKRMGLKHRRHTRRAAVTDSTTPVTAAADDNHLASAAEDDVADEKNKPASAVKVAAAAQTVDLSHPSRETSNGTQSNATSAGGEDEDPSSALQPKQEPKQAAAFANFVQNFVRNWGPGEAIASIKQILFFHLLIISIFYFLQTLVGALTNLVNIKRTPLIIYKEVKDYEETKPYPAPELPPPHKDYGYMGGFKTPHGEEIQYVPYHKEPEHGPEGYGKEEHGHEPQGYAPEVHGPEPQSYAPEVHGPEPQGYVLEEHEPEPQGHGPEPQGHGPEPQGHGPGPQGHGPGPQSHGPGPQAHGQPGPVFHQETPLPNEEHGGGEVSSYTSYAGEG